MFWDQDSKSASPGSTAQQHSPDSKSARKSAMAAWEPVEAAEAAAALAAEPAAPVAAEPAAAAQTEMQIALLQLTAQVDSWLKTGEAVEVRQHL